MNRTNGTDIKPEKERALPISITSNNIRFSGFKANRKNIKKVRETIITKTTFKIRSLKVDIWSLNVLKNSTGINKINKEKQNNKTNQKSPWPFQAITLFSTIPNDSKKI